MATPNEPHHIEVTQDNIAFLSQAAINAHNAVMPRFQRLLSRLGLGHSYPPEVQEYEKQLVELRTLLNGGPGTIDRGYAPLLRQAVVAERRRVATLSDERRERTLHPELLSAIDNQVAPYDAITTSLWFRAGDAMRAPSVADYFPFSVIDQGDRAAGLPPSTTAERMYDEKFHILQAPSLFLPDLDVARTESDMRGVSLAVAFVDIDDFKSVNTALGEQGTDRLVLPRFMRKLEAHLYMRGHAYRQGGDEYTVLLHNTSRTEALDSMNRLRWDLAAMVYDGLDRPVTVSIGVVVVPPTWHLTGREILERANDAKTHAKVGGTKKNQVATYSDPWFEQVELVPRGD